MLLQRLVEYAARLEDTGPPAYARTAVKYLIDIQGGGDRGALVTLTGAEGRKNDRGKEMFAPNLVRTVAIKPKLLADNGEYVLGWARDGGNVAKVAERHASFVDLVRDCARATADAGVAAVLRFLEGDGLAQFPRPADFDSTANLTFRVDDTLPIDQPAVRAFWAARMTEGAGDEADLAQCLCCGRMAPAVERLQFKIKGVPDGQTGGTSIISANADAFESYGLHASKVAPICERCAERFSKALNALLADPRTRLYLGGTVYAFWTRGRSGFLPTGFLTQPDAGQVDALLRSVETGRAGAVAALDPERFYAVGLSGSSARAVVRDWIDTTVVDAQANLARYFALQRLARLDGEPWRPFSIGALIGATLQPGSKQPAPAIVPRSLLRVALQGGPLPRWLLAQVLRRTRAENGVTQPQATLIKMVLLSQPGVPNQGEEGLVELDRSQTNPAYLCGRLLAVLDAIQYAALGARNATIIDRFFGTAATAPLSVFSRLVRGAQPHLAKLRRDKPGAYRALDERLQEIMAGLPTFPRTLNMDEQGMFVLGYYHQRAADTKARLERRLATIDDGARDIDLSEGAE